MKNARVLIVGAGPTGLFLANLCLVAGLDVTIVEKNNTLSSVTKGVMLHAKALELLEQVNLTDVALQNGLVIKYLSFYMLINQSFQFDFSCLKTEYPFYLILPQPTLERILFDRFSFLGGKVLFKNNLVSFEQKAHVVKAKISDEEQIREGDFEYIFGCDGANSTVRDLLNINFSGRHFDFRYILAEGELINPPPRSEASMYITPNGAISVIPLPGEQFRVAGPGIYEKYKPGTLSADIMSDVIKNMQLNFSFKSYNTVADYAVGERIAEKFSLNRVALVGDAAHIHSPAGGQAITTGFQDAVSLMKAISPTGSTSILDDYHNERFPYAKEIVERTNFSNLISKIRNCTSADDREFIQKHGEILVKKLSQLDVYRNIS